MKKLSILLFFFIGAYLNAQEKYTVSGTITDESSGETLLGATVFLEGTSIGTITNEYGFFSLTAAAGGYNLIISYVGFGTIRKELVLTNNQQINLVLKASSSELDEVVITIKDKEQMSISSPQMSVNNLKAKTIKQIPVVLGEVDVLKSLQLLPGVSNSGEGTAGFNVRGGAADQNLVLLDEAIIYNASHLFGFFSVFNNDVIKDVTLYKGGIPAKFGGRVSSVLDIRQKDGNQREFKLEGGLGAISSRLLAEGPIKKDIGAFLIAGRASYGHLFLNFSEEQKGNAAYFYDINFKSSYKLGKKDKLYLSGYYGQDVFKFENAFENDYGNASANLRWNHIFSDKLFSNLSLIYSKYNYNLGLEFIKLDWKSDIKNFNIKYDFKNYLSDRLQFNFGIGSIYYQFNPGDVAPSSSESTINSKKLANKFALENSVYFSLEHKLTPKLTSEYGFRISNFFRLGNELISEYENNEPVIYNAQLGIYESSNPVSTTNYGKGKSIKTFYNIEPRFSLAYQFNKDNSMKLSYNKMTQYIHLLSNTTSVTPLDVWTPSGKYIAPQKGNQYAIGYFKNIKDQVYSLSAEAYYKTVKNRIDYIDGADLIAQERIETQILNGKSRAYGLEFLLKKNKGKFTGWLAYTISKAEQQTDGNGIGGLGINKGKWYNTSYDRTHDVSLTGLYTLNDQWSFGTNIIYQTGRPVTYPDAQYQYQDLSVASFNERNANRLPAYHRVDISATLVPKKNKDRKWKSEWVFGIYNVYNRKNAASISFRQNEQSGNNEAIRTAIFGIVPAVTYNFKF